MKPIFSLVSLLVVLVWPHAAPSEDSVHTGFRFSRDTNGQIDAVEYYGYSGLRRGKLHELPHLERVAIIYGTTLTKDDVKYLSTLDGVCDLVLGGDLPDEFVTVEGGLSELANLGSLESVFLCVQGLQDEDLQFAVALPKLESFELVAEPDPWDKGSVMLTDQCGVWLSRATTLKNLRVVGIGSFSDRFVSNLKGGLSRFEEFELRSNELTDEALRTLARHGSKLRSLHVQSDQFSDVGINYVSHLHALESLHVVSSSLTADCVKHIEWLSRLRILELTVPSVADDGIAMLNGLRHLRTLALRDPPLTNAQLRMFHNHPTLESAFINGSELTRKEVIEFIHSLPRIDHLNVGSTNKSLQESIDESLSAGRDY